MTQPSMFDLPELRRKVQKAVPVSSRLTYQAEHARLSGRAAEVLAWLKRDADDFAAFGKFLKDEPASWAHPTSAELADDMLRMMYPRFVNAIDSTLYVRRGLSDLQAAGVVEKAGMRRCHMSGRTCATWRLKTR